MSEPIAMLVAIAVLGIGSQWLAWRIGLPSILLLLVSGLLAGQAGFGFLDPKTLLGEVHNPIVSLSVAIILFEGGLSLKLREIGEIRGTVRNLVTIGPVVTMLTSALAAWLIFPTLGIPMALLVGAIFIVTGPTVIIPMLRHVRPSGAAGPVLRWEGIVTDPIGAVGAVLLFEIAVTGGAAVAGDATQHALVGIAKTLAAGGLTGVIGFAVLYEVLRRHLVPDTLQNPIALMLVLMVFLGSNAVQHEAGLVGVTLMGTLLANQRSASIRHIVEFKENLGGLLIAGVFVVLAAGLERDVIELIGWRHGIFVALLILVIRPLTVFASTLKSNLERRDKIFLCCLAPRGIVAASVASILGLKLVEAEVPGGDELVPLTFLVIVSTVTIYGLLAGPAARALGLADPNRSGVMILGAHPWARMLAKALDAQGIRTLLVDTNARNTRKARLDGLRAWTGNPLSDSATEELDLSGLGQFIALTPNEETNALACLHMEEVFGRSEVYQLSGSADEENAEAALLGGRRVFGKPTSFTDLYDPFFEKGRLKSTKLTEEFGWEEYTLKNGERAAPIGIISAGGGFRFVTPKMKLSPEAGESILAVVDETIPEATDDGEAVSKREKKAKERAEKAAKDRDSKNGDAESPNESDDSSPPAVASESSAG